MLKRERKPDCVVWQVSANDRSQVLFESGERSLQFSPWAGVAVGQGQHFSASAAHWNECVCCVLSHFSRVQLLVTLWTVACQASQSMGFSRQEYWSGETCPPRGALPDAGTKPTSPALQVDSLPPNHWGSPRMSEGF